MNHDELRDWSKRAADWAHAYHATLRDRPVRAQTTPGATAARLPERAPEEPEPIERIFGDFEAIVPDAMTHWQHPRFFAYFPANAAPASMWAEQLANAIAAQAMLWQTSPAATEIEEVMVRWLRDALGLAPHFRGTIHDSATTATLAAILTMREIATGWQGNDEPAWRASRCCASTPRPRRTARSTRAPASPASARRTWSRSRPTPTHAMDTAALDAAIRADLAAGHRPAGVILATGGTSIGACDRIGAERSRSPRRTGSTPTSTRPGPAPP
jgi:aromatic-L-amino-acid/L-tryptophan decarboxylase